MVSNTLNSLIAVILILASAVISVEFSIAVPILEVLSGAIGRNVFGIEFTQPFQFLSNLGLISLMYLAGLEVDIKLMRKHIKRGLVFGLTTFILPFVAISLISFFLLPYFQGSLKVAVVTGIVLSITSLAIVYPILKESGFLSTEVGKVILGSAAFSEIIGMFILSFFFLEVSYFTVIFVIILLFSILTLPDFSKFLLVRYKDKVSEVELKFVLVLLLGITALSQVANIEVAISSFFIGVITSEVVRDHKDLEKKLRSLVFGFLSPFFFFGIGIGIMPEFLLPHLDMIIILFLIAYGLNYFGAFISARMFIPTHSNYISHLFNMPLPVGLLFSVLAFETGIYTKDIYAAIVVVILLESILSSFMTGRKKCGLDMVCDIY